MTKKHFTIFMAIMLTIAVCTGVLIFFLYNPPAKIGELTVSSGGNSINPPCNVLEYRTAERKETLRPLKLSVIQEALPELVCMAGVIVTPTEDTLDNSFTFSMYTPEGKELYTGRSRYEEPESPGTYVAKIIFSWGNREDNSILAETYFKVIYE